MREEKRKCLPQSKKTEHYEQIKNKMKFQKLK